MIEYAAEQVMEVGDHTDDVEEVEHDLLEISFHAIAKTQHHQTIWVIEKLKKKDLTVLIDGASPTALLSKQWLPSSAY